MAAATKRRKVLELLREAQQILQEWEDRRQKIVAQLHSIQNLLSQQKAMENCCKYSRCSGESSAGSKLGVLAEFPSTVVTQLQVKILASMERARRFIVRDRYDGFGLLQPSPIE